MRLCSVIFASVAAFVAGAVPVSASTVQLLSNDDLVAKSTSIVRAKVLSETGMLRRSTIYTSYHVQVLEVLKGAAGTQLDVAVPGGVAQGLREIVSGAPKLQTGTEYVLFLWTSQSGLTQILGLSQGLFLSIQQNNGTMLAVRPGGSEATLVDLRTGRTTPDGGTQMLVSEIRSRVKTLPGVPVGASAKIAIPKPAGAVK